jgi:hypothetical protein
MGILRLSTPEVAFPWSQTRWPPGQFSQNRGKARNGGLGQAVLVFAQRLVIRESRFRDPAGDSCPSGQDVKSLPPPVGGQPFAFVIPAGMPFATPDRRNGGDNGHLTVAWSGGHAEMRPRQRGTPAVASVAGNPSNAAATKIFAADGSSSPSRIHAPDARGRRLAASQLDIPGDSFGRSPPQAAVIPLVRNTSTAQLLDCLHCLHCADCLDRRSTPTRCGRICTGPNRPSIPAQPSPAKPSPAPSGSGRAVETAPKIGRGGLPQNLVGSPQIGSGTPSNGGHRIPHVAHVRVSCVRPNNSPPHLNSG